MPRGCKLGLRPCSARSCAGTSDGTGSALGSLQFCKPATQMCLQDPFDFEGRHGAKECQGRFRLLFVAWRGASDRVALAGANKSEPKVWANCWLLSCTRRRANLHTVRLVLYPPEGESHPSPPTDRPSAMACMPHAGTCSLSKQKGTRSYLHRCGKRSAT